MSAPTPRALAALVAGPVCIAFAPILVRWSQLPATPTAFWRMALALPFMAAFVSWMKRGEDWEGAADALAFDHRPFVLLAGLCFAGDLAAWHRSIHETSVANATLLANFAPVLVTLVAWRFLGERLTGVFLVGMVLALGGAALLVRSSQELGGTRLQGDGWGFLTAFFYAGYILSVKQARRSLDVARLMLGSTLVCALALGVLAALEGGAFWPGSSREWGVLLGLAILPQCLGQGLIAYALAHLPASFSSVSLLLQPATAALLAWVLLGEPMTGLQGAGAAGILVGILLARQGSRPAAVASRSQGDTPEPSPIAAAAARSIEEEGDPTHKDPA